MDQKTGRSKTKAAPNTSTIPAAPLLSTQVDRAALLATEAAVASGWQIGDVVLDLYEVTGVLGEGGMGRVYKVHHRGWNVDLAVKTPRAEIFATASGAENFIREAETWVNLGLHPHTVSCYYVRTLGGIPRVFAEYVEGGSLADWIHSKKLYDGGPEQALERILDIAIQFAWGLHYAHEQGLVHQDVKPANVMLTADGVAKVTDFGLAKARALAKPEAGADPRVGPGAHHKSPAGTNPESRIPNPSLLVSAGGMTPAYCSPEQAAGLPLSRATDIWSWGLSVLEMFTGEVTWMAGQAAPDALEEYLDADRGDDGVPRLPDDAASLLRRCFADDPGHRPRSMTEVVDVLRTAYASMAGDVYPRPLAHAADLKADALNNRAISLLDLGDPSAADQVLEKALSVQPHHAEATYNRGLMLWRSARIDSASLLKDLNEVASSREADSTSTYFLALAQLELGNYPTALSVLERIRTDDAAHPGIRTALNTARERLPHSRELVRTCAGHASRVNAVCLSGDAQFALSAGDDRTIRYWEVATGRALRTFEADGDIVAVCLSSDSRYALSGGSDGRLRFWDLLAGRCERVFEDGAPIESLSATDDVRHAVSGDFHGELKLWDIPTGRCLRAWKADSTCVNAVCISTDGRHVVSAGRSDIVDVWELPTGERLRRLIGHTEAVTSLFMSADGAYVLSGSADKTVRLWETASGRCVRVLVGHTRAVSAVALSRDGRYALSGSRDATARLWDIPAGRCLHVFEGHAASVNALCFSRDGAQALTGSGEFNKRYDNTVRLWNTGCATQFTAPLMPSRILSSHEAIAAAKVYQDELAACRVALARGDAPAAADHVRRARRQPGYLRAAEAMNAWTHLYGRLPVKEFRGGWETQSFAGSVAGRPINAVCISRDGRQALSANDDGTLTLWQLPDARGIRILEGHTGAVTCVQLSRDGQRAVSGGEDAVVRIWDLVTGRSVRALEGHTLAVKSVCLTPDGRYAVSGGNHVALNVWEVATGRCVRALEGHADYVRSVCVSHDGSYALSGAEDKTVRLWNLATGCCIHTLRGHARKVTSVCLDHDTAFAVSGSDDQTIKLWDLATGGCVRTLEGHTDYVSSLCLTADSRHLFSGGYDTTVRLWDVATGRCVRTFEGHGSKVTSVCVSEDRSCALSAAADGVIKLWAWDWELGDMADA